MRLAVRVSLIALAIAVITGSGAFLTSRGAPQAPVLLVWKPAVQLCQKDNQFEVLAAVPGVEAKDLDVQVTPDAVLIKVEIDHQHTAEKGTVRLCEFKQGKLFRSVHFPAKIDPASVKAEYRNGMLRLTAAIAKAAVAHKVDIQAA